MIEEEEEEEEEEEVQERLTMRVEKEQLLGGLQFCWVSMFEM